MAEKIAVDLIIESGQAAKSVKEIKQSLKETKDALLQVGEGSPEFKKLAKAAAEAKDKLEDVNDSISALDPGKLGAQFSRLGSTIASGFQAASGAAALFGESGKELEATLLKVQAATALAQGIQGVQDAGKAFKAFFLVLRTNPLGLIITAIGALGTALFLLKDKVKIIGEAFDFLVSIGKNVIQFFKDASDSILGTSFAIDDLKAKQIEYSETTLRLTKNNEKIQAAAIDREIALRKAANKSTYDLEIEKQNIIIKSLGDQIKFDKNNKDQLIQQQLDAYNQLAVLKETQRQKEIADANKIALEDRARLDVYNKAVDDGREQELERQRKHNEEKEILNDDYDRSVDDGISELQNKQFDSAFKEVELDKLTSENKIAIAQNTISTLGSLGDVLIKNARDVASFQKAIAVSQIAVDTGRAISGAVAASAGQPFPLNLIAITTGVAAVLANIAKATKILNAPLPSVNSTSVNSIRADSGVNINPVSNTQTVLPTQQIEDSSKGALIKAYVVETEITESQKNINKIKQQSTI